MLRAIFRPIRFLLAAVARLLGFLTKGTTVLLIVAMLSINVASLTISSFNVIFSTLIETFSGAKTLLSKSQAELDSTRARTNQTEADAKKAKTELSVEKRKSQILADENAKLTVENKKLRKAGPDVTFRGKTKPMRDAVEETVQVVQDRTAKVAATNVSSMPAEGIPFWGVAVIVAATSYEIYTSCETMKDMRDLIIALNPESADHDEVDRVCGMRVPTKEELWQTVKDSPSVAWDTAAQYSPDLPAPDWSSILTRITETLSWR